MSQLIKNVIKMVMVTVVWWVIILRSGSMFRLIVAPIVKNYFTEKDPNTLIMLWSKDWQNKIN